MCPGKVAVRDGPGKRAAVKGTRRDDPETVAAVKENQERRSPELWRRGWQPVQEWN